MSTKWAAFVCFFFIFSLSSFALNIEWLDKNGNKINRPDKNEDTKYWNGAMSNAMRDLFTKCLPPEWRRRTRDFYNSKRKIYIMISDANVDWKE